MIYSPGNGNTRISYCLLFVFIGKPVTAIFFLNLYSRTKVLTHLSKTIAFYQRPSVISNKSFFVDSETPLSSFSMLKYAGHNIEKGFEM